MAKIKTTVLIFVLNFVINCTVSAQDVNKSNKVFQAYYDFKPTESEVTQLCSYTERQFRKTSDYKIFSEIGMEIYENFWRTKPPKPDVACNETHFLFIDKMHFKTIDYSSGNNWSTVVNLNKEVAWVSIKEQQPNVQFKFIMDNLDDDPIITPIISIPEGHSCLVHVLVWTTENTLMHFAVKPIRVMKDNKIMLKDDYRMIIPSTDSNIVFIKSNDINGGEFSAFDCLERIQEQLINLVQEDFGINDNQLADKFLENRLLIFLPSKTLFGHFPESGLMSDTIMILYWTPCVFGIIFLIHQSFKFTFVKKEKKLKAGHIEIFQVNSEDETLKNSKLAKINHFDGKSLPTKLILKHELGSGAFGTVRFGTLNYSNNKDMNVAVKMLKDNLNSNDRRDLLTEITTMESVGSHPNIIGFIASCSFEFDLYLIIEFCSKGNLKDVLAKTWNTITEQFHAKEALKGEINVEKENIYSADDYGYTKVFHKSVQNKTYECPTDLLELTNTTTNDLLHYSRQAAAGMRFLALNHIVHRDLAARNILVQEDDTIKISDFGLSRDIYTENVYERRGRGLLPIKWMALETVLQNRCTIESDVWSFGILLWEIFTFGSEPYPDLAPEKVIPYLQKGNRLYRPINCPENLYHLMMVCWNDNPHNRPTFEDLENELDKLLISHSPINQTVKRKVQAINKRISTMFNKDQDLVKSLQCEISSMRRQNGEMWELLKENKEQKDKLVEEIIRLRSQKGQNE